jgi:6-phosphogluconate dehydrogenase (decarboxylating)
MQLSGIRARRATRKQRSQGISLIALSLGTAEQGYLHCGSNGAGHLVKMVHNSIEYGIMAAYAEGFGVLKAACAGKQQGEADAETTPLRDPEHYQYEFDLTNISLKFGGAAA